MKSIKTYSEVVNALAQAAHHNYMSGSTNPFLDLDLDLVGYIYDVSRDRVRKDVHHQFGELAGQ